ncbi:MAG: helix-turn-helix transcriptional regulator [Campylobacterota bacterium]|nr:helix-turn-helix transcriptional regulator [Campylobacterota bacterium]
MNFNSRLKTIREDKGLSQGQFGKVFDVSQKTISNWESGRNEPDINFLNVLSNKWAININWLLTGKGEMHLSDCNSTHIETKQRGENNVSNALNFNGQNNGTININNSKEMSHIICEEIKKLPLKRIEYFYHLVKLETLKED